jgi:exosortase A-associated hydrolase 2
MTEPFFFAAADGTPLFAVWRDASTPDSATTPCWVVCPPFAEEEKSAHRTLVELCEDLRARGESTLYLTYRGTGDSGGDFSQSTLVAWREDILAACVEAARRSGSTPGLIGLRMGASLAVEIAEEAKVEKLILLEPVLSGRSFLMQLGARKKLRAMMTEEEKTSDIQHPTSNVEALPDNAEDYDGWALGEKMREELKALDLMKSVPSLLADSEVLLMQVGPRSEIAPPLQKWVSEFQAKNTTANIEAQACVMPPFWNRLDLVASTPLLEVVADFKFLSQSTPTEKTAVAKTLSHNERAVTFQNKDGEKLIGVFHEPETGNRQPPILMLHGWTGYRTGPHQMLTRAARRLAAQGFPVLRFDFSGRGDSDGNAELATLATMTEDARAALRWLEQVQRSTRAIALGLCSGCEVALATAALENEKIEKLVLWSAPVFAAQKTEERVARKRKSHLKDYARKLLRPATWAKVISGKVDVRGVQKVLDQGGGQENKNVESGDPGFLPRGWRSGVLQKFRQTTAPVFLVYGTSDPTTDEALKWHGDLLATRADTAASSPEVHLVPGANHSYYGLDWEAEVFDATQKWLLTPPQIKDA